MVQQHMMQYLQTISTAANQPTLYFRQQLLKNIATLVDPQRKDTMILLAFQTAHENGSQNWKAVYQLENFS